MSMSDALDLLNDPDVIKCPFGLYALMQESEPVAEIPGIGFLVTRYDDAMAVLRNPTLFSSAYTSGFGATGLSLGERPRAADDVMAEGYPEVQALLFTDDPVHRRHRGLVGQAFSPRRVAQLEGSIKEVAEGLLDRVADRGRIELHGEFAAPLPLTVVADALGVPTEDIGRFKAWSDTVTAPVGRLVPDDEWLTISAGLVEFQHYFASRIDERRVAPRDDLLTDLVTAQLDDEDPLSTSELLNIITQLLVAGNETTANAICSGVRLLVDQPELLDRLRGDAALVVPFTEEVLRLESPVQGMPRVTTAATELGGVEIPEGARVVVLFGAANRDGSVFPGPDEVDLDRPNLRAHLAFSQGPHHCVGSALGRAELRIAFELLLTRLPGLRLAPGAEPTHRPTLMLRGYTELPLEFDRPPG
ncbi:MAG TPA: cytochrome P450 [Acidimicrobiia bacterium]|nr:cytochrome P450 [Acidimicrobiia bacterium]